MVKSGSNPKRTWRARINVDSKLKDAVIFGATGAIGSAFADEIRRRYPACTIHAISRSRPVAEDDCIIPVICDLEDETALQLACETAARHDPKLVIVATGMLHENGITPEKALRDLTGPALHRLFAVNTVLPALVLKHMSRAFDRKHAFTFAALSARVGSISDNRLGGWYAYRASKAALNMIIRTAAIELARRNSETIIVGLHPGTVASALSEPFQGGVADEKLFEADFSARRLLDVLESLEPEHSGLCFDWAGKEVPA